MRLPSLLYGIALIAGASVVIMAAEARQRVPVSHNIVIDKMAFGAPPPDLHVGDTIIWVNRDMFRHTATASDRSFNVDLMPGRSGRITLKRAGRIPFACAFHPGMKGVLTVAR